MEYEFSAWGSCVYVFGRTPKADVSQMQLCEPLDEVFEGTAETIKPPDNKNISLSNVAEGFLQPFALDFCPTRRIGVDFETPGPC